MTELEGKCVAELRAELEAATARLREDLQGQLWNYYGALRDPASALKERVEELEDKLEDLTKAADKSSCQTQADTSWRVAEAEQVERRLVTLERQRQDAEVASKEWLQDLSALKHRVANLEMAQSGAARQLKEVQGAQADLQEKLHAEVQQGLQLKEAQSALKNELTKGLTKMSEMEEQMKEVKEVQKAFDVRLEEQAAKLKKEVTSWTAGLKGLEDQIKPMDERLKVLGHDLRQLADLLQHEVDDREKGADDLKRQLAQEEAERTSAMVTADQKISALTTQTAETLKTLKGNLEELTNHLTECQIEERVAAEKIETLGEKIEKMKEEIKEESNLTKEQFETQQRKATEELEQLKKHMQHQFNSQLAQQMAQVNSELKNCQKEEAAAADRLEKLGEKLKEEASATKERFAEENRKRIDQIEELKRQMQLQFNTQLQQMQRDLRSFLQEQDSTLQERVQKQMTELHETILQRTQALINSRTERCQADISRIEKRADQSDAELRSLKELQSATRCATEQKVVDLQKEVFAAVQKNSSEIQYLKVEQNAGHKIEEGQFTSLKSTEDKLCADLKAVKEGIDSIKNSVNSVNGHAARLPWPGAMASGVMTPPSPTVSFWPTRSQPCSPVSGLRTTGPLLRPSTCNACAGSSGLRTSSVSPPWMRPQTVAVSAKAPPPITWVNCPEPVAHMAAASHVPVALLPSQAAAVASQQSGSSSESSTESHTPGVLAIHCPATPGLPAISGEYSLVAGVCPNGRPLWKHRQQELWLYYGTNHRWFVGGPDAKDWKFKCEAGFIYSDPVVATSTPEQASGWARFQGGLFVADPSVTVSLVN